jgi:hypothetical protein
MSEDAVSKSGHLSGTKALIIAPVAVIVLSLLIALIIYPVANMQPKGLPVALLSEDEGMQLPSRAVNVGDMAIENIPNAMDEAAGDDPAPVRWIEPSDRAEALDMLESGDVYAVIIFPTDFSSGLMTVMSPAPEPPTLEVHINQGLSPAVASALTAMFPQIEENLGARMRTMLSDAMKAAAAAGAGGAGATGETAGGAGSAGPAVPSEAVLEMYRQPFVTEISYLQELPEDMASGQAHLFAFVLLWICCLVASVILFRFLPAAKDDNRQKSLAQRAVLVAGEAMVAVVLALMLVFIMDVILNINVPTGPTIGFAAIASLCVLLMIHGVLAWTGIGGISLFVLVMALGLIASNLPYELLPAFWQDWVYPWIPLRFISEGLCSVFYRGEGVFNAATNVLLWIGGGGLILLLLSIFKHHDHTGKESGQN